MNQEEIERAAKEAQYLEQAEALEKAHDNLSIERRSLEGEAQRIHLLQEQLNSSQQSMEKQKQFIHEQSVRVNENEQEMVQKMKDLDSLKETLLIQAQKLKQEESLLKVNTDKLKSKVNEIAIIKSAAIAKSVRAEQQLSVAKQIDINCQLENPDYQSHLNSQQVAKVQIELAKLVQERNEFEAMKVDFEKKVKQQQLMDSSISPGWDDRIDTADSNAYEDWEHKEIEYKTEIQDLKRQIRSGATGSVLDAINELSAKISSLGLDHYFEAVLEMVRGVENKTDCIIENLYKDASPRRQSVSSKMDEDKKHTSSRRVSISSKIDEDKKYVFSTMYTKPNETISEYEAFKKSAESKYEKNDRLMTSRRAASTLSEYANLSAETRRILFSRINK
jgi:hypothetical protein